MVVDVAHAEAVVVQGVPSGMLNVHEPGVGLHTTTVIDQRHVCGRHLSVDAHASSARGSAATSK